MSLFITIINVLFTILTYFVLIYSLLSFFLAPYHPIRRTMGQVVEPILAPIRRLVPPMGGFDFSSLILIIAIQLVQSIVVSILRAIF